MRSVRASRAVPVCTAAALVALAGCGSPAVVTHPAGPSGSAGSAAGSSTATGGAARAVVGDTLDLAGRAQGARMAVTVTAVVDPANPANDAGSPSPGRKLVAVQFRLHNTGSAAYADSPSNGAVVIDQQGQGFNATVFPTVTSGPSFPGTVPLAPGDTALGYIVFDLPVASRPATVQFTLASGFAEQTGQWTVPPAASGGAATPTTPAGPTATVTVTGSAPAATSAPTAAAGPAQTVRAYYAAINARDYRRAWELGGRNLAPDYRTFVNGYAGTAAVALTVTGVGGDTVFVVIDSLQTDGTHRVFSGTYTVRGGVIVAASVR